MAEDKNIASAVLEAAEGLADDTVADDLLETGSEAPDESPEFDEEGVSEVEVEASPEAGEGEPVTAEEVIEELLNAPEHWNQDYQDAFNKVDRGTQDAWMAQQKDFQRGFDTMSQDFHRLQKLSDQYGGVAAMIEKQMPSWQAQGMTMEGGLGQLLQWGQFLAQNPSEAIPQIAKLYGIDMQALGQEQPYLTPEDRQRDTQLRGQAQEIGDLRNQMADDQHDRRVSEIGLFRSNVDADGKLTHPHFDSVSQLMTQKFEQGYRGSLDQCYEETVWQVPEVRNLLIAEQNSGAVEAVVQQNNGNARRAESKAGQRVTHGRSSPQVVDDTDGMSTQELVTHMARKQLREQRV